MLLIFALKNSKLENFEKKLERKAKSFRNISQQLHLLLCDALCVEPHVSLSAKEAAGAQSQHPRFNLTS